MKVIMTAAEMLKRAALAITSKTLYVKGGWGQLATSKNKAKAIKQYEYNKERAELINDAAYKTWFFDCVCFIKAILWGWCCNYGDSNGGAKYESNGIEDCTTEKIMLYCGPYVYNINDKTHLKPGAILYMKNHVGIYAGDNKVIECAPSLGGVRVTELTYQRWSKYGLLECIDYGYTPTPKPANNYEKGEKIVCNNTPLYVSCDAKKAANHISGYYYISDGINFQNRYRICKDRIYCGAVNKVIGYVNKKDIVPAKG